MSDKSLSVSWKSAGTQSYVVELRTDGLPTLHRYFVSEQGAKRCCEDWGRALAGLPPVDQEAEQRRRLIAEAPAMFELLEKWAAVACGQDPQPPCRQADCLTCSARALIARIEPFGPNTHTGVWIDKETSD